MKDNMKHFHYIEAYYPRDDPDMLTFRHRVVVARNEYNAYHAGLDGINGGRNTGDRVINNFVVPFEYQEAKIVNRS